MLQQMLCFYKKKHCSIYAKYLCSDFHTLTILEQFCAAPENSSTFHILEMYRNASDGIKILNYPSEAPLANQTIVSYVCNDGLQLREGSLNGSCVCRNYTDEGSCAIKPEWVLEPQPKCKLYYRCCLTNIECIDNWKLGQS